MNKEYTQVILYFAKHAIIQTSLNYDRNLSYVNEINPISCSWYLKHHHISIKYIKITSKSTISIYGYSVDAVIQAVFLNKQDYVLSKKLNPHSDCAV